LIRFVGDTIRVRRLPDGAPFGRVLLDESVAFERREMGPNGVVGETEIASDLIYR